MSAVSSNFWAHYSMHSEQERYFALDENCRSNQGSLVIHSGPDTRSDLCISSVCNCDHDYYFELHSVKRSGTPNQYARCFTAHHGDVRAVPRANRTCSTADSPTLDASSN